MRALRGEALADEEHRGGGRSEELAAELEEESVTAEGETRRPPGVAERMAAEALSLPFEPPPKARAARLPVARLEMPSSPRLELTPSPVPRVSLAPATGDVDISLVPGPGGSRRLPTLAAQHVLGRRQPRRRAPAITLPPPRASARDARLGAELAQDVRSSKREIVLGLTIGLGLSLLLAGLGQAYLQGDPTEVAAPLDAPAEPRAAEASALESHALESVTSSARAEPAPAGARAALAGGELGHTEPPSQPRAEAARREPPGGDEPSSDEPSSDELSSDELAMVPVAGRTPAASSGAGRAPRRSQGPRPSSQGDEAPALSAPLPPRLAAGKSSEPVPASSPSLSPAESAGLGLDLPL